MKKLPLEYSAVCKKPAFMLPPPKKEVRSICTNGKRQYTSTPLRKMLQTVATAKIARAITNKSSNLREMFIKKIVPIDQKITCNSMPANFISKNSSGLTVYGFVRLNTAKMPFGRVE